MRHLHLIRILALAGIVVLATAGQAAVTDGLVAHYKFDEVTGSTANDAVRGAAGTGTMNNFPVNPWVAGQIGGGVLLDGINDWISTPIPLANNITAFSFSGWVYAETRPTWASIAKNWGNAAAGQFHLGLDLTSGQMSNYLSTGVMVKESTVFPLNAWQHVAVTYDGTTHRLYRNGSQVASGSMSPVLVQNCGVLAFGVKTNDAGTGPDAGAPGYWKGRYDDFGVWNRALTPAEITTIYQNGLAGLNLSQSGAPTISSFTATPPNVPAGGTTTLAWTVTGQTSLTLSGGGLVNQNVNGQTSIVTPALSSDTTFTLTATNSGGNTQAQKLVGVGASVQEPQISEFLAEGNTGIGLGNNDYRREDWIEIRNPNATYALDLTGYHLTDNPEKLDKWTFPAGTTIPAGGYLIIFCSEKNLPLHASFQLDTDGEYLALVKPDGVTIVQQFSPAYPPQVPDVSYSASGYLATPTPGAANTALWGPVLTSVTTNPPPPLDADNLVIEVSATPQGATTINNVTLIYRVMFGSEVSLSMVLGGDGKYRATIPASASTPGQMVRWRVTAADSSGRTSKWPLYLDAANSPQYLGTMVQAPAVTSPLPILHRFVQDTAGIDTATGTRCAVFFNGEFFDNLAIRIRGFTSRGWPKKSHKIEMNSGYKFKFKEGVPRVTEFDLNTTYTDKSYVRSVLTSELDVAVGLPVPEIFQMRVQQNAAFYSVTLFTENPDEDFLKRWGIDPDGAYYKAPTGNTWASASPFEKKTRLYEAGNADLATFIGKITTQSGTALETTVFDEVDVPGMVNYMATVCISQNIDASDKNHFGYRDTNGNREWRMLPWDLDLTFGPNALNTDTMVYDQNYASHPYIGASPYLLSGGKLNRFLEAIVNTPRTQSMLDARIRTLTDQFLATNWFQNRIDQLVPVLNADVTLDKAQWGSNGYFGAAQTLQFAADRIKTAYLNPRLGYLTGGGTVGIPGTPPALPALTFVTVESLPASGNQEEEYVEIKNTSAFAADVSGYTIAGQIEHTFKPGTVILPNESLYLSPKVLAFRSRATSPKGAERLLVQGDYPGQLSARGGTLTLRAGGAAAPVIATTTYPGNPSPVQQYLRITEVNYGPVAGGAHATGNYEFIELRNTGPSALNLTGVKLMGGIDFDFTGSALNALAPGAYMLVVKNVAAFEARYGTGLPVVGVFTGSLDNSGDRLHLVDAIGESVLDFTYQPEWHPITNAGGFTLTVASDTQAYTQWDVAAGWQPSGKVGGTPGTGDQVVDTDGDGLPDAWEAANGLSLSSAADADLDLDADGQTNRQEFVAGTLANKSTSRFRVETITRETGNIIRLTFTAQANRSYAVQRKASPTTVNWAVVQTTTADPSVRTVEYTEAVAGGTAIYRVITPAP